MDTNMSMVDRLTRGVLVGPVALVFAWIVGLTTWLGIVLVAVGVIMVLTALAGFCPLYALLRIRTNATQRP